MLKISRLDNGAEARAKGHALVQEYCEATAAEMQLPLEELVTIMPDYNNFPERYLQGGAFFVAEIDDEPAGCVGVARFSQTQCEMNRMWIRPSYQGRGLGRELGLASISAARDLGYVNMVLEVLPTRLRAISLYEKLGFTRREQLHVYNFPVLALERKLG